MSPFRPPEGRNATLKLGAGRGRAPDVTAERVGSIQ
jgi:hypothetical protein